MSVFSNKGGVWDAKDCALILIDYQPEMFKAVRSSDPNSVEFNVTSLAKAALAFKIPIVLSTIAVKSKTNSPTIEALQKALPGVEAIDRSTMNAWEDENFLKAVKATGKKRLVFGALWTEICLAFPMINALKDGYDCAFVADACGGESKEEHELAIQRLIQAGAIPNTTIAAIAEWFRDWQSPLAKDGREILVSLFHQRRAAEKETQFTPELNAAEEEAYAGLHH